MNTPNPPTDATNGNQSEALMNPGTMHAFQQQQINRKRVFSTNSSNIHILYSFFLKSIDATTAAKNATSTTSPSAGTGSSHDETWLWAQPVGSPAFETCVIKDLESCLEDKILESAMVYKYYYCHVCISGMIP